MPQSGALQWNSAALPGASSPRQAGLHRSAVLLQGRRKDAPIDSPAVIACGGIAAIGRAIGAAIAIAIAAAVAVLRDGRVAVGGIAVTITIAAITAVAVARDGCVAVGGIAGTITIAAGVAV